MPPRTTQKPAPGACAETHKVHRLVTLAEQLELIIGQIMDSFKAPDLIEQLKIP
jgi:hypothetical protein